MHINTQTWNNRLKQRLKTCVIAEWSDISWFRLWSQSQPVITVPTEILLKTALTLRLCESHIVYIVSTVLSKPRKQTHAIQSCFCKLSKKKQAAISEKLRSPLIHYPLRDDYTESPLLSVISASFSEVSRHCIGQSSAKRLSCVGLTDLPSHLPHSTAV